MKFITIAILISTNLTSAIALNAKEIKRICRKAPNYKECIRSYNNYKFYQDNNIKEIKRGPIEIEVIPY